MFLPTWPATTIVSSGTTPVCPISSFFFVEGDAARTARMSRAKELVDFCMTALAKAQKAFLAVTLATRLPAQSTKARSMGTKHQSEKHGNEERFIFHKAIQKAPERNDQMKDPPNHRATLEQRLCEQKFFVVFFLKAAGRC